MHVYVPGIHIHVHVYQLFRSSALQKIHFYLIRYTVYVTFFFNKISNYKTACLVNSMIYYFGHGGVQYLEVDNEEEEAMMPKIADR